MAPLEDIRECQIRNQCHQSAWLLANTYFRHLIVDGSTDKFNQALHELSDAMFKEIAKHGPAEAATPRKTLRSVEDHEKAWVDSQKAWVDSQRCIMNSGLACPKCGGELMRTGEILTSYPPQERLKCGKCSHETCVRC